MLLVTTPADPGARIAALAEEQETELEAAEAAAAAAAVETLAANLAKLTATAVVLYEALPDLPTGDKEPTAQRSLLAQLREALTTLGLGPITDRLVGWFADALQLGNDHAMRQAQLPGRRRIDTGVPEELRVAAQQAEDKARAELVAAADRLVGVETVDELETALAGAHKAVSRTEATARWGVNSAVAAGVHAVAEGLGTDRLWLPERDACVHCQAYAGVVAAAGSAFPAGLTYGEKPHAWSLGGVKDPPLHPRCRCRCSIWRREWGIDYPDSLKREAQRSIVRGWSLDSEPESVRIAAADRLLRRGVDLPKSVQEYAARAVRRGEFPRGRRFPG